MSEVENVKAVLANLIAWMVQSANSPISTTEAKMLLQKLEDGGKE